LRLTSISEEIRAGVSGSLKKITPEMAANTGVRKVKAERMRTSIR